MSKIKGGKKVKVTVDHHLEEGVLRKVTVDADIEGKNEKGKIDFAALRSGGFIKQRQKDKFTVRLKCPGGRMSIEKLKMAAKAAEKYGDEFVHFSVRQSLEIPTVDYRNFDGIMQMLGTVDQGIASCGPRVRVPTACGGCEYNPNGITDTQRMAQESTDRFFGARTNHKFKLSWSGCPHDCIKTAGADLGFQGGVFPVWEEPKCTGCTICASACQEDAIHAHPETGKPIFDVDQCIYCDDCVRACPTLAWQEGKKGHIVRIGGKAGRHPLLATIVAQFVTDEEAHTIIDTTIKWYQNAGKGKGRTRLGLILREEGMLDSYMKTLEEAIGPEKLVKNPPVPQKIVIHPQRNPL
jgi:dissimilatory sulfite reductase (desulfoviridin) alpha/beta subunit